MKKHLTRAISVAFLAAFGLTACVQQTAEQKIAKQTSEAVYTLTAEEKLKVEASANAFFGKQWPNANNERGFLENCRPTDSNFNGLATCIGQIPSPKGGYIRTKMFCVYRADTPTGCSDEDTVK